MSAFIVPRETDQASLLVDLIEHRAPERAAPLRVVQGVSDRVRAAAVAAAEDQELSDVGRTQTVLRTLVSARKDLRAHERAVASLREKAAKTREGAIAAWGPAPAPGAAEEVRREIRDRKLSDLDVATKLLEAVDRDDRTFVDAVLGAPSAFPLTGADWAERAREAVLQKSPLRPAYDSAQEDAAELEQVVGAVRSELGRVAERSGLRDQWRTLLAERE